MDIYQTPWKRIEGLIKNKRIFSPKEVLNEINDYDDTLAAWGKQHPEMFIEETAEQIKFVKEILLNYPSLIKKDKKHAADPWVIALAIEMIQNPQKTLVEIKRIVVTEEKLRGHKVRIPYVCQDYTIESIDILDMFRMEGWKF